MKTHITLIILILSVSSIFAQKPAKDPKWRSTETDTLTVAQTMFDDANFVMAYPYLNQLQKNHPNDYFLKYMTGVSSLFTPATQSQSLTLLLDVYEKNKNAEDIEYYIALAYHYNGNFGAAIEIIDKYLAHKKLSKQQIRGGETLKEYCSRSEKMEPMADEGKIDDYIQLDPDKDE